MWKHFGSGRVSFVEKYKMAFSCVFTDIQMDRQFILYWFFKYAVLAEWKPPVYDNRRGIVLVTATTRRNSPNVSFFFILFFKKKYV